MPRKATIILPSTELLRELFNYDSETGSLKWRRRSLRHFNSLRACESWNGHYADNEVGWLNANGYLATKILTVSYLIQRIVWKMVTGQEPPEQIDHIDGNRINNQWKNLRAANAIQTAHNRGMHKNNTSGFRGVSKRGNKYIARVMINGKFKSIGTFLTAVTASKAYESKIKELYGDFYRPVK